MKIKTKCLADQITLSSDGYSAHFSLCCCPFLPVLGGGQASGSLISLQPAAAQDAAPAAASRLCSSWGWYSLLFLSPSFTALTVLGVPIPVPTADNGIL